MIKVPKILPILTVLLSFAVSAASAAGPTALQLPASAERGCALSELLAAAPGGHDALNVTTPPSSAAPRSESGNVASIGDASQADLYIKDEAAAAQNSGEMASAGLLIRLLNEGTLQDKLEFMNGAGRTYAFPERFYRTGGMIRTASACRVITEWVCRMACWGLGANRRCAMTDCRNVIVNSCP